MRQEIDKLIEQYFGQFRASSLLTEVENIVTEVVDASRSKTQERIKWLLELESPPFTLNTEHYSSKRNGYLKEYKTTRLVCMAFVIKALLTKIP